MPIQGDELLRAVAIVADREDVRFTVKEVGKGAVVCAATTFIAGLLMGPVGMAIGGAAGGIAAYSMSGNFKSLSDIIRNDLTDAQKRELVDRIQTAARGVNAADIAMLAPLILNNSSMQTLVLEVVKNFVTSELRCQIVD
ncbi:protein C19orf12 homolog [Teleopsis dalmanni]|uniref:protein C19orf12 homolog n=1 Tax=Teleopsis dalmanni TaxID=139649 RepID=UPI000D32CFB5|nr:protein C19orf12 homolog [Teleopsis dalmanni]